MSDSDSLMLEGEITYNEIAHVLKNMNNEKALAMMDLQPNFSNFSGPIWDIIF